MPEVVLFDTKYIGTNKTIPKSTPAATAGIGKGLIIINPKAEEWGPGGEKLQEYEASVGWSSARDDDFTLLHECGHVAHLRKIGEGRFGEPKEWKGGFYINDNGEGVQKDQAITHKKISAYGASDPDEMIAEVYAGHLAGKKWGADVLRIYAKYGGPKLPKRGRG
jgi:hypothetical protein